MTLDALLELIAGLDWQYVLVRQDDGNYLGMMSREGSYEFQGEADTPLTAMWLAFVQAVASTTAPP